MFLRFRVSVQHNLSISETLIPKKIIYHKSLRIFSLETCIHFLWPTMKPTTKNKNKRRSQARKRAVSKENDQEQKVIQTLTEAFSSASIDDVVSAYREANGDPDKAAEFLSQSFFDFTDDPSTSSMSSGDSVSVSGSGSSEGFVETICVENMVNEKVCRERKHKKVVAVTGTVSSIIGKEYVRSNPRRDSMAMGKLKVYQKGFGAEEIEEAEQFLYSMLGKESELSLTIVKDVLCEFMLFYLFIYVSECLKANASETKRARGGYGVDKLGRDTRCLGSFVCNCMYI